MQDEIHYSIGEAADLLGVSVPTLRLYEREGLLLPIRRSSKHRLYTEADLKRVRSLRETINHKKISIAGIRTLLSMIPCWKIRPCPEDARTSCPAYETSDRPCWMVENKPGKCSRTDCRSCAVYAETANCDNIKQVIAQYTIHPSFEVTS
jgi:MerR family transcriptional regulator/heat shock protein HspR